MRPHTEDRSAMRRTEPGSARRQTAMNAPMCLMEFLCVFMVSFRCARFRPLAAVCYFRQTAYAVPDAVLLSMLIRTDCHELPSLLGADGPCRTACDVE